jgi:hypothetical protein
LGQANFWLNEFLRDSFVLIPLSLVLCRAIETATVIEDEELTAIAKQMREPGVSLWCSLRSFAAE